MKVWTSELLGRETLTQKGIDTLVRAVRANHFFSKIAPFSAFVHSFNKQVIFREIINSHVKSFHDRFNNPYPKDFDPSSSSESVHKYLTFYRKQEIFWQPKHSIIHKKAGSSFSCLIPDLDDLKIQKVLDGRRRHHHQGWGTKKKTNSEIFSHDAAIFPLLLGFAHLLYGEESLLTMDGDALFGMRHHQQVS